MHTTVLSATPLGVDAHLVNVEVDLSYGLLQFFIVGLPDTAIKESKQRILTALKNSGIRLPERKITVNLAPADIKKEGTLFDLPIALAITQAAGLIAMPPSFLSETVILGELSLDGSIRPVRGVLAIALDSYKAGKKRIVVPRENAEEAALVEGLEVIAAQHITHLVAYFRNELSIEPTKSSKRAVSCPNTHGDFSEVKAQHQAKRALILAAAGHHNILFVGSPGSGKTMLAQRLSSIMPAMSFQQMLETTKVYSISGKLEKNGLINERPFRNPHHTISQAGLVGGGSFPQPGEISLAHHGILFLDELTEFKRSTLEVLREPLENHMVTISRAMQSLLFPASFLLVAALNPCPCGYFGDKRKECSCNRHSIEKYLSKISGPLLDRIDLQIPINAVSYDSLNKESTPLSSAAMKEIVLNACAYQQKRQGNILNAHLKAADIERYCTTTTHAQELIKKAFDRLSLSMRGYHKLLKVARTIADIAESKDIDAVHVQEALAYRSLDHHLARIKEE